MGRVEKRMDWGSHMHFMSLNIYMSFVLKDKDYNDYNDITISFLIILTVIIMIMTMNLHMH